MKSCLTSEMVAIREVEVKVFREEGINRSKPKEWRSATK
ncbi:hypothetical protein ABID39_000855 [Bartonella japonica]|uniref:Uncharacterized protein n=1 Tax=Bartonella japonica TaxID=357761 RepID=A0ABV2FNU6_9HYPH